MWSKRNEYYKITLRRIWCFRMSFQRKSREYYSIITYFCILIKAAVAFLHSQLGTYGANIHIRNNGVYFEWAKLCLY